jgi:hypothetical protein
MPSHLNVGGRRRGPRRDGIEFVLYHLRGELDTATIKHPQRKLRCIDIIQAGSTFSRKDSPFGLSLFFPPCGGGPRSH